MTAKILIVDDSPATTRLLGTILTKEGYEIKVAHDGSEGLREAYTFQPDLILLDVMMPGMNGWDTLSRLREFSEVPVIMLTAVGGEQEKVQGLDLGADDYMTKPYGVEELKARVRAALRRANSQPSEKSHVLRFDGDRLVIDPPAHTVTVRGEPVDLTPTEYKLLLYLAYNAGQVLAFEQILDNVWGVGYENSVANIKYYVSSLRQKIETDPRQPRYILTTRGVGYCMAKI